MQNRVACRCPPLLLFLLSSGRLCYSLLPPLIVIPFSCLSRSTQKVQDEEGIINSGNPSKPSTKYFSKFINVCAIWMDGSRGKCKVLHKLKFSLFLRIS